LLANTDKCLLFNDEQLRLAANLRQYYESWRDSERALDEYAGYLGWKTVAGRQYLYRTDSRGQGTSLGPRSSVTEEQLSEFQRGRLAAEERVRAHSDQLKVAGAMYRTLRLPAIASAAAPILREADRRGLLGDALLVVGTSAIVAYEFEAGERFASGMDATEDFDLAWAAAPDESVVVAGRLQAPLLSLLKAVDSTYVVNSERPFQARNRNAYEVEILAAPSVMATYPRAEPLRPVPLPEQEWLLRGRRVDQVVCGRDGTPARVVAPDPRWFALHKCWLADKPTRNRLKSTKDRRQGDAVLRAVRERMPHYPMDAAFIRELPSELAAYA
jgi:hypothetical protein